MSSLINRPLAGLLGCALALSSVALSSVALLAQQTTTEPFVPTEGQPGKDVVWVPTPEVTVKKMMEIAKVTPQDYVIDLGSGDGRNVIAAAKIGATALGVEYNQDMVDLSKRRAADAGVTAKAQFVQGDMYVADISKASVMALFLLPQNMLKLRDKFVALKPGSRIVSNTFSIEGWEPDYTEMVPDCSSWCTVLLWIVPANVDGTWQTPQGTMTITQEFQRFAGSLGSAPIEVGTIKGEEVTFTAGPTAITARASGNVLEGTAVTKGAKTPWRATRAVK